MTKQELLNLIDQAAAEGWEELDLRDQEIAELPPEIGKLQQLKRLRIGRKEWWQGGRNSLTTLPQEISRLVCLELLDLSGNELMVIPLEIGQLGRLREIDLSSNQLTAVPPEIGQLSNLTRLYLSGNQVTALPDLRKPAKPVKAHVPIKF